MEISNICIEHINNRLCLVYYYNNSTKEIIIINNKYKDKLFNLLLDIQLYCKKKYIK